MAIETIEVALRKYDKRYFSYKINDEKLNVFLRNLAYYINMTHNAISNNESEEHIKNIINSFLKTMYSAEKYEINTGKRIDSTIKVNGKIQVMIEAKNPGNKNEMVSSQKINVKALHELLFYYMCETRDVDGAKVKRKTDAEIRRGIITDSQIWMIIDANELEKVVDGYLEKLFYKYENRQLIYSNNNDKFYADIKEYLSTIDIENTLSYVFFDINEYKGLRKEKYLYKVFNKTFLLKEYQNNDTIHVLNDKFYQELLYIMGLKEKSGKEKKTIEIDFSIKNSLAYQVYSILKNDKEYNEFTCIEETFELVIIWINRLLFIKLFEGQLISFNEDSKEYHILDKEKIHSFQNLQDLFFEVLGKRNRNDTEFLNQFVEVPYLNSSLFERYEIERRDININAIKNEKVTIKTKSVLGKRKEMEIPILEYILDFLNSYNFASEISKNNTVVAGKDIIDASVLGLIFEKLNGYKDGSFYTPSIITEYMCMETIEFAIVDKINQVKGWDCQDLFEIKAKMNGSLQEATQINDIINTLKVCDPSVGSGHFLVSALNRIIFVKKQLGVLFKHDKNELLTEYDIDIVDDVLVVFDGQGRSFKYDKYNSLSQIVQETLFNEKRTIIENCIFGVDLNSKAVAICQLRLWIELLKNAYYKHGEMETLPNIDINIKTGNSLVNKLRFDAGKQIGQSNDVVSRKASELIKKYKKLVQDYKKTSDKTQKAEIKNNIERIKSELHGVYSQIKFTINANNEFVLDYGTDNSIYSDAFEWAIEFPELIDNKNMFMGFDCIIGNPPYGLLNKKQNQNTSISVNPALYDYYRTYEEYKPASGGVPNIFRLFICRCFSLLRQGGKCCLIFQMSFMCDLQAANIRQYVMRNARIDFLEAFPERDIENKRVFKEVKMSVCILGVTKTKVDDKYKFGVRINKDKFVDTNNEVMKISLADVEKIDDINYSIPLIRQRELGIFLKMTDACNRMKEYSKCYTGEIDISLDKQYITDNTDKNLMLRGAQVQKYYITNDISQGEIFYLNADEYLRNVNSERSRHHQKRRIVMQGITGVNEKWRLKMTMAYPPYFCANSVNYLLPPTENDFDFYILGLLNSKLLNWYFAKLSTNSNVNGYEIDGLPIKVGTVEQVNKVISLVKDALANEGNLDTRKAINQLVYEIYGITDYDIPIVEG